MNNSAKSIFEMSHNVWKKGYADRHESWLLYYRHIKNCMTGLQRVSKEFKCRVQTEFKSEYCNKLRGWGRVGSVETMVKSKDSLVSFLSSTSRRISHSLFYRALWVFIISLISLITTLKWMYDIRTSRMKALPRFYSDKGLCNTTIAKTKEQFNTKQNGRF